MPITLRELTRDTWRECIALTVAEDQAGFVAPNLFSLAQAKVEPERVPLAIYDGDTMVGFVMYNDRPLPDGTFRLSRLMIDRRYQGRGYGRAAAAAVIQRLCAVLDCREILLDYARDNVAAARLYGSLGFQPIKETEGEIVARLLLQNQQVDSSPVAATDIETTQTPRTVFVPGEPVLFLTKGEPAWKAAVQATGIGALRHPRLRFVVASFKRRGQTFDIDNLAKSVLDVMGSRAETLWLTMEVGLVPGLEISDQAPPPLLQPAFSALVAAPPSRSVRSMAPLPELLAASILGSDEALGLELRFESDTVPIGNCGFEGPIKPLIDACGPVLGTYHMGSRDYRIRELRVTRGEQPGRGGVRLGFWLL